MRDSLQGNRLVFVISLLTALCFMLIGYDNGVIDCPQLFFFYLLHLQVGSRMLRHGTEPSTVPRAGSCESTIVASYEIGCFAGAILAFILGERLGRKRSIRLGAAWMVVGAVLQAAAFGRPQLIVGRIVSGIGMGCINSTAPVLQAEVSPKATRGQYACAQLSTLNFGIFLSYWIVSSDYAMTKNYTGDVSFRFPIAFQLVMIIPIFVLTFIIPESPRWLFFHDRSTEAMEVLLRLEEPNTDGEDPDLQAKFKEIEATVLYEKSIQIKGYRELFRNDGSSSRRRLLIACSVQFFQQLGGINGQFQSTSLIAIAHTEQTDTPQCGYYPSLILSISGIIYYANFIFSNSLGFSADTASLVSGFLFTWFFIASFIPWFLIDTVGRRKLLISSVLVMGSIFAVLAGVVKQIDESPRDSFGYGVVAAVFCFLYFGAFTTGFQATVWVYPPEILPIRIRAKGTALATACNWIINFAVVEIFPPAVDNIGWKTYLIFMCFNFLFAPIMYLFYPETKGKSLEEIDMLFGDGVSADIRRQSISRMSSPKVINSSLPVDCNSDSRKDASLLDLEG
ncbi:hypothetical protein VP01_1641g1 [Puccinia sorghi]|uniref:Major facilitator superfamily (MFS) profile domain-containing protein n=1 Tax=Puccinia sorghi TaxID=27349 RepID=A0A0L6VH93_9BASI|nr:hypothetical protein VP01_1641g1 [Puccinia sorghi]